MPQRAARVWQVLRGEALPGGALHCGRARDLPPALAEVAVETPSAEREAALLDHVAAHPMATLFCDDRGAIERAKTASTGAIDGLIEDCRLGDVEADLVIYRDLGAGTFLASQVIATYWRADGVMTSDHQLLLDTLWLSSALSARRP